MNKSLICIFFFAPLAQAQIASSSFFGETKSRNPGVIAKRVNGFTSVALLKDNIKKEQEFTAAQASTSADGTASSEIAINSNRFFRGGKGGGTTTELQVDIMKGTKSDEIIIAGTPSEVETTADLTLLNLGIGYGVFGIGFTKSAYDYTNSYSLNIDGTTISSDFRAKIDMTSFKFDYANNIGSFVYGAYAELAMNQIKSESPNPLEQVDESSGFMFVGFGAGIKTNGFHFEVGYEMPAQEQEQDPNLAEPITDKMYRAFIVTELKYKGMAFGYTAAITSGGMSDPDKTVTNQLVYESITSQRIEHIINVLLGSEKGWSFGGSFSSSSIEVEENIIFLGATGNKVPTKVTSQGVGIKVSYVW